MPDREDRDRDRACGRADAPGSCFDSHRASIEEHPQTADGAFDFPAARAAECEHLVHTERPRNPEPQSEDHDASRGSRGHRPCDRSRAKGNDQEWKKRQRPQLERRARHEPDRRQRRPLPAPGRNAKRRERRGPQVEPEQEQIQQRRGGDGIARGRLDAPAPVQGRHDRDVGHHVEDHQAHAESLPRAGERRDRAKGFDRPEWKLHGEVHVRTTRLQSDAVVVVEIRPGTNDAAPDAGDDRDRDVHCECNPQHPARDSAPVERAEPTKCV